MPGRMVPAGQAQTRTMLHLLPALAAAAPTTGGVRLPPWRCCVNAPRGMGNAFCDTATGTRPGQRDRADVGQHGAGNGLGQWPPAGAG